MLADKKPRSWLTRGCGAVWRSRMALSTQRTERKKMGGDGDLVVKKVTKGEHKVGEGVVGPKP